MSDFTSKRPSAKQYWLSLAYLGVLLMIACAATMGLGPKLWGFIYVIPLADKLAHCVLIGGLTLSLNILFRSQNQDLLGRQIPIVCLWLAGFVAIEECSQIFVATRTFDLGDLAANWAGIIIACVLVTRKASPPST